MEEFRDGWRHSGCVEVVAALSAFDELGGRDRFTI
jgi:hypothetical protein